MSRLLSILLLIPVLAIGQQSGVNRFKADNGVYYAFVVDSTNLLSATVPQGLAYSAKIVQPAVYDEQGNETTPAVTEQKTIDEYFTLRRYSIDGSQVCIAVAVKTRDYGRDNPVGASDLAACQPFLASNGKQMTKWLNKDEYLALMETPEWKVEE